MRDPDGRGAGAEGPITKPDGASLASDRPSRSALALAHVFSALVTRAGELVLLACLSSLCLLRRIETLEPVNTGGDAATKWQTVREWFYLHDFSHAVWNHHMTRFGVLVPAYLMQRWVGHGLRAYYAAPFAACVVQVVFVYACGKRLSGRLAGTLAALLLIYSSVMTTAGSQLLPDLFTGTYGIVMLYLYLRYADAQGRSRSGWLVACALTAFVGYLAKETMVFFYPGMALAIWMAGKKPREIILFFGVLLCGLALETLAYRTFTEYKSRFAIVLASHIRTADDGTGPSETTFWGLFARYRHLDQSWLVAFYSFLPCAVGVLAFTRSARVRATLSVVASFFFFLTFTVRSVSPLLLWQRFINRYLDPSAPFVELVNALFLTLVIDQFCKQLGEHALFQPLERLKSEASLELGAYPRRVTSYLRTIPILALCLWAYSDLHDSVGYHTFSEGLGWATAADDAYRRNLPIVIHISRSRPRMGALATLYAIYMDPRALLRGGRLPPFAEASRMTRSLSYLVRNPETCDAEKVRRLMDAGCAVEVRERTPFMTVSATTSLPASCDTLGAN